MDSRLPNIIVLRFEENWTYQQIGDEYGISRERVRQLLAKYELDGKREFDPKPQAYPIRNFAKAVRGWMAEAGWRFCQKHVEWLAIKSFCPRSKHICRECNAVRAKEGYRKNPGKRREAARKWCAANPGKRAEHVRRHLAKKSPVELREIFKNRYLQKMSTPEGRRKLQEYNRAAYHKRKEKRDGMESS